MRSKRLFVLVLLMGGAAFGLLCSAGPLAHSQPFDPEAIARAYLAQNGAVAGTEEAGSLELLEMRESPGAHHVRFQQAIYGVPVFGAYASVSIAKKTEDVAFALDRRSPVVLEATAGAQLDANAAVGVAKAAVDFKKSRGTPQVSAVYFPLGGADVLAWQVLLPALQPLGDWLVIVDANNAIVLQQQNLLRFDSGQVFDPNPVVGSGGSIPPPLDCGTLDNENILASRYQSRTLLGIQGGQGRLKGQYVDLTAPGILGSIYTAGVANEPSHVYTYPCSDRRFEETMVYYHVDTTQRKIQSLGFTGKSSILARPIAAHAHYDDGLFNFVCNAFYSPLDQGLHFGVSDFILGCPDVAEDADFVIHEYGHALQDDQVPGQGMDLPLQVEQTLAMGEGFGDFLAATITGDPCWSEWSRPLDFLECGGQPGLRWLNNSNVYPADFEACDDDPDFGAEEPHCAGEIWGGALWDLVEALGNDQAARDLVLTLVLGSHFYIDPVSTFAEAASAVRQADVDMFGGAHVSSINSVFAARGIVSTGSISDFSYAYVLIKHTFRGDLTVRLKAGDLASPSCDILLLGPDELDFADDVIGYEELNGGPCASFLPPSQQRPWRLEVQDKVVNDDGQIVDFEIALAGTTRCLATDLPVFVPDNSGPVYSLIDCSSTSDAPGGQPTNTPPPSPTPPSQATDTPTSVPPTDTPTFTRTPTRTPTPSALRGDANCDGRRNALDALAILQYSAGLLDELACADGADANGDGRVNSLDAALVLQFVAGLIDEL